MKKTALITITAAAAAVLLTGCGGSGGGEDYGDIRSTYPDIKLSPYPAPAISEAQKAEFLNAVNAARSQQRTCGEYGVMQPAPPLAWSDTLYRAAYEHSFDMASTGVMTHDGSGGATDWTAVQSGLNRASYVTERAITNGGKHDVTENVASGYGSTAAVIQAWLNSPGHCYAIMDPSEKSIGMARVGNFWTQEFSWYDPGNI